MRSGREIQQQVYLRPGLILREIDCYLPPNCRPVQRRRPFFKYVKTHPGRTPRTAAELILLEKMYNFRPAFSIPGLGIADWLAIGESQRVRKSVGPDARFIVVDRNTCNGFRRVRVLSMSCRQKQPGPKRSYGPAACNQHAHML